MSDGAAIKQKVRELQASLDYWQNPEKQAKARELLARSRSASTPRAVHWTRAPGGFVLED